MTHFVTLCEHDPCADLLKSFRSLQKQDHSAEDKEALTALKQEDDGNVGIYQAVVKDVVGGLDVLLTQEPEQLVFVFNLLFSTVSKLKGSALAALQEAARLTEAMKELKKESRLKEAGEAERRREEAQKSGDAQMEEFENAVRACSVALAETVSGDPATHPEIKINLLSLLVNMLTENSNIRPKIVLTIFKVAAKSKRSYLLEGQLKLLPNWIERWTEVGALKKGENDVRQLYFNAYKVAQQAGDSTHAQKFLMEYLSTFQETAVESLLSNEDLITSAAQAVIQAVTLPIVGDTHVQSVMELRDLRAVAALEEHGNYAKLYQLLDIYHKQTVTEYLDFCQENKDYLDSLAIEEEPLLEKMRMLTLCSLDAPRVTFDELREKLHIEDTEDMSSNDQVEEAVVGAVQAGLIQAKIDQQNSLVTFQRRSRRTFNQATWHELRDKLTQWRSNTVTILEMLHQVRMARKRTVDS